MKIYRGTYPRSSELYHYGILGQKWGVRRFQNPDGSLTAEGRERYGSGNGESAGQKIKAGARHVGSAVAKGAKAVGRYAVKKFKQRHTSLMTKEELDEYTKRLAAEKNVAEMQKFLKSSRAIPALKVVGDVLSDGGRIVGRAAFNKLSEEMFKSPSDREQERMDAELKRLNTQADTSAAKNKIRLERENTEILNLYNILTTYPKNSVQYMDAEDRLERLERERSRFVSRGGTGGSAGSSANVPFPTYGGKKK